MVARERRARQAIADAVKPKEGLTPQQLVSLRSMEQFQWMLRFVRRPMFLSGVSVVFSRGDQRFVVLEADGTINHSPRLKIRP